VVSPIIVEWSQVKEKNVKRRLWVFLAALLLVSAAAAPARAALQEVGQVTGPHGFPLYYTDTNDLSLELCLDEGWCFFDPIDPSDPNHVALGVGGEVFWWLADAVAPVAGVVNGRAVLVLAMEGTFGGDESVVNGNQISFGRIRIRVDVPEPGMYTVLHPFGSITFDNVIVANGINYTADIGASNFLDVEAGFLGALQSGIGPFLTWPEYESNTELQVPILDGEGNPTGSFVQYVGNMNVPHVVVGSEIPSDHPSGFQNFFRVIGPGGIVIAETDLFSVMGKVYDGKDPLPHEFPEPPTPILAAVGPINRVPGLEAAGPDFGDNGSGAYSDPLFNAGGFVADGTQAGYPVGYPIWYQDRNSLRLTICQGGNPMCISDPVDATDANQRTLATGGETFWWAANAFLNEDSQDEDTTLVGTVPPGMDAEIGLAIEGTFGGSEAIVDGGQIGFGRLRIRIDTPVRGDYTIIHPYGEITFFDVPAGKRGINHTADIGITDPADPDYAFIGTLFSDIGPNFLTWPNYAGNTDLQRQEPAINPDGTPDLVNGNPVMNTVQYVGDPAIAHVVTGGTHIDDGETVNYFRVIGPNGIDVRTSLFSVSGRVYDPETFRTFALATMPVANPDAATTIATAPVTIDVLANDTLAGAPVNRDAATIVNITQPQSGAAVLNGDKTITYTANAGFAGTATFTYQVSVINPETQDAEISEPATVTVTVQPAEVVSVNRAKLDLRKLRWDIRGTGNVTAEGRTMTVRLNSATGQIIGTATVSGGVWSLKTTTTTAPPTGTIRIYVTSDTANVFGPFTVQAR
jgi:hypothetical protein